MYNDAQKPQINDQLQIHERIIDWLSVEIRVFRLP